ncbi:hypothetical protein [Leucobacter sp. GX0328]
MTAAALLVALTTWAAQVNYRLIDRDRAYGAQCWDLAADYAERVVGCPLAYFWTLYDEDSPDHTLVSSMWLYWPVHPGIVDYFERLDRYATIQAGDVLIWARSRAYPASHIAVALAPANGGTVLCMTQNPGASRMEDLTLDGLLGVLRPYTTPDPLPVIPEEDPVTTIYVRATGNSSPLPDGKPARIWAGNDRRYDGTLYSDLWAVDTSTGTARRLTMSEKKAIEGAYAAIDRPIPVADLTGNEVEILVHGPKGKR